MKGPGCNSCPVNEFDCDAQYRGSRCSVLRDKYNLGDPDTKAEKLIKCDCNKCAHKEVCKWYEQERQQCGHYADESRFIELPCKVGQTVYKLDFYYDCSNNEYETCDLFAWSENSCMKCHKNKVVYIVRESGFELSMLEEIGKTVFLTPEEAEQALKEVSDNA